MELYKFLKFHLLVITKMLVFELAPPCRSAPGHIASLIKNYLTCFIYIFPAFLLKNSFCLFFPLITWLREYLSV